MHSNPWINRSGTHGLAELDPHDPPSDDDDDDDDGPDDGVSDYDDYDDSDGNDTLLHFAVRYIRLPLVEELLSDRELPCGTRITCDLNARGDCSQTPLSAAMDLYCIMSEKVFHEKRGRTRRPGGDRMEVVQR